MSLKPAFTQLLEDVPCLARIGGHFTLLIIVTAFALVGRVQFNVVARSDDSRVESDNIASEVRLGGPELAADYLPRAANPITLIPKRERIEIVNYVVQPNDTVSGIASRFEVKPETVLWANAQLENDPDMLSVGETLAILPVNGVYHTVVAGDTLESIAKKYKVDPNAIFNHALNNLKPGDGLNPGQKLIVPGGRKPIVRKMVSAYSGPIPASAARGTGNFGWPVSGYITQKFWEGHPGIDIGAATGAPVLASDSGFVVFAIFGFAKMGYGEIRLDF